MYIHQLKSSRLDVVTRLSDQFREFIEKAGSVKNTSHHKECCAPENAYFGAETDIDNMGLVNIQDIYF